MNFEDFPIEVREYLRRVLVEEAHPFLLHFDDRWNLLGSYGDGAIYGLDAERSGGLATVRDLFVGLPLDEDQELRFVELPNGRSTHIHRVADETTFYVLVLDAEPARLRERMQQQVGHEAVIASYHKTRAISQLKQVRNQLERERMNLEEANALKNALISTLSHEFRTPLTSIFGYLHLLDHPSLGSAEQNRARQAIRRSATHLYTLAENLLEYGRGEAAEPMLSPVHVDLERLRADLESMFRPLAEDKGLVFSATLDADPGVLPVLDEVRVRQVAINLLSNAIRYTSAGSISATLRSAEGNFVLAVQDTGIGIAPEYRSRVFRPFNRGGQSGSKGAGLGLSIVRRLVAQMHGTLTLESEPGQGSTFRVELPSLAELGVTPGDVRSGRRVLVVDDDPDIVHLVEALLADQGYAVTAMTDADAAIERARREQPDVLLIDVEMPALSGNAAVFKLRAHGYGGRIVTMSATATAEARDAALRAGSNHYLTKPLNLEHLIGVVAQAANEARANAEA